MVSFFEPCHLKISSKISLNLVKSNILTQTQVSNFLISNFVSRLRNYRVLCSLFAVFNSRRGKKCFVIIDILKYVSYYFLFFREGKKSEKWWGEKLFFSQSRGQSYKTKNPVKLLFCNKRYCLQIKTYLHVLKTFKPINIKLQILFCNFYRIVSSAVRKSFFQHLCLFLHTKRVNSAEAEATTKRRGKFKKVSKVIFLWFFGQVT